ncbi:C-terminal helicase domain-containing protein, partial [uncultured Sphingomonas sp.]|uniref:helicase-related protein n=1 Tax=uncultured Sphingomonas sp. TaxID=158754 RepID=UPI0025DE83C7
AQFVVPVAPQSFEKRKRLRQLLGQEEVRNAIIFCNRKTTVRELNKSLKQHGFRSGEIHGDMEQPQRLAELELFKRGDINILVASDVAARGLDIKGVSHVFNFDAPWHPDDYVHRIGRTGRGGATGTAYTFVAPDDAENLENIEKLTGQKIDRLELPAPAEEERPARRTRRDRAPRTAEVEVEATAPVAETVEEAPRARSRREETRREQPQREQARREEPRETRSDERRRDRRRSHTDETPDDGGWNGPIPDFLKVSFGI